MVPLHAVNKDGHENPSNSAEIIDFPKATPFVTVVRPRVNPRCVTKAIWVENGTVHRDMDPPGFSKDWSAEAVPVVDFEAFAGLLARLAAEGRAALIHGAAEPRAKLEGIRRRAKDFQRRSHLVTFDLDALPLPAGIEMISDTTAERLAEALRPALPEPFASARFVLQLTPSHGAWKGDAAPEGARVRLWFAANRPVTRREIEAMLEHRDRGGKPAAVLVGGEFVDPIAVDTSVWRNVQLNYIAIPSVDSDEPDPLAGHRLFATGDDGGFLDDFVRIPPAAELEARAVALSLNDVAARTVAAVPYSGEIDPEVAECRFETILRSVPKPLSGSSCHEGSRHLALANLYQLALDAGLTHDDAADIVAEWAMGETDGVSNVEDAGTLRDDLVSYFHEFDGSYRGPWGKEFRADWNDRGTEAFMVPGSVDDEEDATSLEGLTADDVAERLLAADPVTQWRRLLDRQSVLETERAKAEAGILAALGLETRLRQDAVKRLVALHRNAAALEALRPRVEAAAEAAKPGTVAGFQTIDDPEPEDDLWLIEGVATRVGVTLLAGRSQAGKSTALHHLMGSVSTGRPFFGREVETKGACLYLYRSTEGAGTTRYKIKALRKALGELREGERFDLVFREVKGPVEVEAAIKNAKAYFEARGTRLVEVGIDSLAAIMGLKDENDNAEAVAAMVVLSDIAERQEVHLSVIAHSGKASGSSVRGASGFGDQVSNILSFEKLTEKVDGLERETGRRRVTLDKARLNASGDGSDRVLGEFELASIEVEGPKGRPIRAGVVREIISGGLATDAFNGNETDDEDEAPEDDAGSAIAADLAEMRRVFSALGPEVERTAFRDHLEECRLERHEKAEERRKAKSGRRFKPRAFEALSDDVFRKRLERARKAGMITPPESRNAPTVRLHPSQIAPAETSGAV